MTGPAAVNPPVSPPQTVQLRHDEAEGGWHIDWMLDLNPAAARLTTFRVARRIDRMRPGERLMLERIADHRRDYLTYEGPISDGRGRVTRLCTGRIAAVQNVGEHWAFLIVWIADEAPDDAAAGLRGRRRYQRLQLVRRADHTWVVQAMGPATSR